MTELKKCPFCGWGTIVDGGGFFSHACECNACHVKTKNYKTWEEAVEAWNTRKGEAYDTVRPVKSTKDINCSMCQYFLTGNNNYPCNHCSQGRVNHFKLRFKVGEQDG